MTSADYAAQRKDPRWQKKRLEIMQRDEFKCRDCRSATNTLAVHHSYYVTGRLPWEYPDFSLETLCEDCHTDRHDRENFRIIFDDDSPDEIRYNMAYEWETELDWIFGGDPSEQGRFWYLAGLMAQAVRAGHDRGEIFKMLETALPK